jgi:hypothetical protein
MTTPPPPPMPDPAHTAWQDLAATALVEDLDPPTRRALQTHLESCPTCRGGRDELRAVADLLPARGPAPPADLEDRIVWAATRPRWRSSSAAGLANVRPAGLVPALSASVAALVLLAVVVLQGRAPVLPGTLGATEVVTVQTSRGVQADVAVVPHTWGTEVVLQLDGVTDPRAHDVLVVVDGDVVHAGTFLGTDRTITCRMNAAVLREAADGLLIRGPDGQTLVEGRLDPV